MTFLLISEPFDELQEILNDLSDNKLKKKIISIKDEEIEKIQECI